jgi:hypothetical protein
MAGEVIGGERLIVPKSGFRVEVDGCDDLRLTSCGKLEGEMSVIEIEEGGRLTFAQQETNKIKFSPVECVRPVDLAERRIEQWWDKTREGFSDHRNGTYYFVKAGQDVAKIQIRDIIITKHSQAEGDAESDEDPQQETFTLKFQNVGSLERL